MLTCAVRSFLEWLRGGWDLGHDPMRPFEPHCQIIGLLYNYDCADRYSIRFYLLRSIL